MKIGILSDTHNLLRPEVLEKLAGCDAILHGGDISSPEILTELEKIAPVTVVRGNNDKEWAEGLPETVTTEIGGVRIFMVHNKKQIPSDLSGIDLVIFGHSHKYEDHMAGGVRFLNPGSCGKRLAHQEITLAVMTVGGDEQSADRIRIEKIVIPHPEKRGRPAVDNGFPTDLGERIPAIVSDISKGKTVAQIAKKHKISEELAEAICRMYLTHPGVDTDGILKRLGR